MTNHDSALPAPRLGEPYLLTPGPLTTSYPVKSAMLRDWGSWDGDFRAMTVEMRTRLLAMLGQGADDFDCVPMQGSGTFSVEAMLGSFIPRDGKALVLANGAYGQRIAEIAEYLNIAVVTLVVAEHEWVSTVALTEMLARDTDITHVAMVHCETTSGILNPIEDYAPIVKEAGKVLLVDAMSSFAGIDIKVADLGIDFLISSANKCIQGVPGMGFVIAKQSELLLCEGRARSLSLDLFSQWKTMEDNHGKWRFTSPTHVVRAFQQALAELNSEGGIAARAKRYAANHQTLIKGMKAQGFQCVVDDDKQSPFISTFVYPDSNLFDFNKLYECLKEEGFVIYPGKVTATPCFRIGHIGEVYPEDMQRLLVALANNKFWEQEDALENVSA